MLRTGDADDQEVVAIGGSGEDDYPNPGDRRVELRHVDAVWES
jgi:hypothetical protein